MHIHHCMIYSTVCVYIHSVCMYVPLIVCLYAHIGWIHFLQLNYAEALPCYTRYSVYA